jgi:hypothetical protein
MQDDMTNVKEALGKQLSLAVMNFFQFIAGYVVACLWCWRIAVVLTAGMPMLGLST